MKFPERLAVDPDERYFLGIIVDDAEGMGVCVMEPEAVKAEHLQYTIDLANEIVRRWNMYNAKEVGA